MMETLGQVTDGHNQKIPRVSVVIPHLNEPEDLRRCLASLDAQKADGVPFEILVVDNGSRNPPIAVCSEFGNVRLEHEQSPGPGPARSRGANLARAGIIAFIDADCIAGSDWICGIAEYFDRNRAVDILAGDIRVARQHSGRATAIEAYESIYSYRVPLFVERDHYAASGNMSVRSETWRAVGSFGGLAIAEDRDWGQRATAMGFRLAYAPQIQVVTPACGTFTELTRRWDRAIAHDFQQLHIRSGTKAGWVLRSLLLAVSPLFEIGEIVSSDKVSGMRERWLAFVCLVRVRLYRCRKMLAIMIQRDAAHIVGTWNRE